MASCRNRYRGVALASPLDYNLYDSIGSGCFPSSLARGSPYVSSCRSCVRMSFHSAGKGSAPSMTGASSRHIVACPRMNGVEDRDGSSVGQLREVVGEVAGRPGYSDASWMGNGHSLGTQRVDLDYCKRFVEYT